MAQDKYVNSIPDDNEDGQANPNENAVPKSECAGQDNPITMLQTQDNDIPPSGQKPGAADEQPVTDDEKKSSDCNAVSKDGDRTVETDQAYDTQLHENPKKSIRKGFVWIGIASLLSQILDAVAMIVAVIFLSTEEMGAMTLALSFAVVFECFNSLGTNSALLQDNALTHDETHSVFWFASGFGMLAFLVSIPLAWPLAYFYHTTALIPMFIVAMLKLPIVSIAAIPLQLINRRLEYKKISIISTVTSLIYNCLKIVFAALGFGAWSFVLSNTLCGFGTLIGAFAFSHYKPRLHFKWAECSRFIKFGVKHCLGGALDQLVRNLHYFIVGKFLGQAPLGIYKIAYELAMTPALAMFNVVARSSFPVFSRLQDKRAELTDVFIWNQRNISIFAAVPCVFLLFCAADIFAFLPNKDWLSAAPVLPFVLVLAYIRTIAQTHYDLYRACGHPEYIIWVSGVESILVMILCSGLLFFFPQVGIQGMLLCWTGILLFMFSIHRRVRKRFIDVSLWKMLVKISHGLFVMLGIGLLSFIPWYAFNLLQANTPQYPVHWFGWDFDLMHYIHHIRIAVETLIILACIFVYRWFAKRNSKTPNAGNG